MKNRVGRKIVTRSLVFRPWVGLLLFGAVAGPAGADEWAKSFQLMGKPELRVETDDGDVRIGTWDRSTIEARVVTAGWKIGEGEVRISEHQAGNKVQLEVRVPRRHFLVDLGHRSIRVELMVPRVINPDIHTQDGNIAVEDIKGEIRLHSGDGHIEARGLDGNLHAKSGDGRMTIRGRFSELELQTGDGSIDAEIAAGSRMATSWSIHTGDGSVKLRLPDDFAADLDAHTGDGHINLDFPVTVSGSMDRSTVRGKMNGGGETLEVRTGDGSIHLEKL